MANLIERHQRDGRSPNQPGNRQIGGDFSIRIHGARVPHYLGPASIKMYDKHGFILRVETTTNDVTFFRTHRIVEQRDGKRVFKRAYLTGIKALSKISDSVEREHRYRGFNLLDDEDQTLF